VISPSSPADRLVPGAEVLHGELVAAGHLTEVVIEIGRGHVAPAAAANPLVQAGATRRPARCVTPTPRRLS
jgi:hypothetical protein